MPNDPDPELEKLIHSQLQKLPLLSAPSSLMPRVLAAVQAQADGPWWRQPWWRWPRLAQAAFLVLTVLLAGFISNSGSLVSDGLTSYSQQLAQRLGGFSVLGEFLLRLLDTAWLCLQDNQPLLLYALAATAVLYLVCIGLGTLFVRVAFQRS